MDIGVLLADDQLFSFSSVYGGIKNVRQVQSILSADEKTIWTSREAVLDDQPFLSPRSTTLVEQTL